MKILKISGLLILICLVIFLGMEYFMGEQSDEASGQALTYYQDRISVLESELAAAKTEKPKQQPERIREKKLKFSFKEQREFENIDEDIANLEAQLAQCEEKIAASGADFVALQEAMAEKEALEQQLEEKMERWVYLNDLAERIEAQNS